MKKSERKLLGETLDRALDPPTRRKPALASRLSEYDDETRPSAAPSTSQTSTMGTLSTQSTQSTLSTHSARPAQPVAPKRDFMKMANSIHRQAVPAGFFKGKCKQIYDFLYSRTRGAIVPSRTVRLTRKEIMKGADIGSTKTLFLNLRHLREVGLVTWDERVGPHEGNDYEVHLPEEITMGTQSTLSTESASSPKVDRVLCVESTESTHSLSVDYKDASGTPKTSFKTNTERDDDDAALAGLSEVLNGLSFELTGKPLSTSERERWRELAEVLRTEAKIAGARTTVSSLPAFLSEHLRRRLWKKDKREMAAEAQPARATEAPQFTQEQLDKCPDCGGSRYWYPGGYEKGVAKCPHARLVDILKAQPSIPNTT